MKQATVLLQLTPSSKPVSWSSCVNLFVTLLAIESDDGSIGKSVWPSFYVESTRMAPSKNMARPFDIKGSDSRSRHSKIRKGEETTPQAWRKGRHQKGNVIMNKYGMDPNKERRKLQHRQAGHMARAKTGTESSMALRTTVLQ